MHRITAQIQGIVYICRLYFSYYYYCKLLCAILFALAFVYVLLFVGVLSF